VLAALTTARQGTQSW